jgi:hypothetical protein
MQTLYRVSETGARVINTHVAHIHARRENGPRWNPAMTEEENRSYGNLIVLCLEHASEIDLTPEHFPAEMLREWKRVQVATQERAAKAQPPLTEVEAGEVMRQSFGLRDLTAAIAAAVPFSALSRSRDEALDRAVRQSLARRATRLLAVPADRQDAVLSWMSERDDPVVEVPEGGFRVLVAPMGAGKSEQASRWWDEGLSAAQADARIEIPVWLDARRVTAGLDVAVTASMGHDPARPCRVVIDNLDGVSPGEAAQLLDEARTLVRTWPLMGVLVTSRPGVAASGDEVISVDPWPAQRGIDLVRVITGSTDWRSWTAETASLLTSPLTAIAVAARLLKGRDVRVSRLTLLQDLARTVVEQKRPDRATPQLWDELARLASRILSAPAAVTAASFGNEAQIWQLTDTGLVVSEDGALRFALPLLEQHFGAQALRCGVMPLENAAAAKAFPRWRYAVAFAVRTSHLQQAEQYMLTMARTNPAALSWTLEELADDDRAAAASATAPFSREPDLTGPREHGDDAVSAGRRLREAVQALIDGFGACGKLLSPHRDGRLVQWGVQLLGDRIAISEARVMLPPPDLVAVAYDPWDGGGPEWGRRTLYCLPRGPLGRWSWARDRLREPLADLIRRRRLPLPPGSPLVRERKWVLACRVMQITHKRLGAAIPLADLRQALDVMMQTVERSAYATWAGGGLEVDSHDVRWLYGHLQPETGGQLCPPWPGPDRRSPWARWPSQGYSPELTQSILTEVLSAAVTGYRDLVAENFPGFGWTLGLNSILPVQVEGTLVHQDSSDGGHSRLNYQLIPSRAASHDPVSRIHLNLMTQPGAPSPGARVRAIPYDRGRNPFYIPTGYTITSPVGQSRAATNLAYHWLAADLLALGWIDHAVTFND